MRNMRKLFSILCRGTGYIKVKCQDFGYRDIASNVLNQKSIKPLLINRKRRAYALIDCTPQLSRPRSILWRARAPRSHHFPEAAVVKRSVAVTVSRRSVYGIWPLINGSEKPGEFTNTYCWCLLKLYTATRYHECQKRYIGRNLRPVKH